MRHDPWPVETVNYVRHVNNTLTSIWEMRKLHE